MVGLIDSLQVKGITLRNRIVMPPMQTGLAKTDGSVTDETIEHYVRRSEALGLLIVEHSYVSPEGKLSVKQLGIYDDRLIPWLEKLSTAVHATSTPAVIQINHAGRSATREVTGMEPVAPSPSGSARELRDMEIEALVEAFAKAAERAIKAGFDGVEIHGAHGFLLNQFYSPLANRRTDRYGGSLENRMRLPLEVVRKVRERISDKMLLYRLGSVDLDVAGTQVKDSKKFAVKLEQAGVDVIDVSGGLCGSRPSELQATQGFFIPQAEAIKRAVRVPVIGVGGITDPEYADKLIREGRVDLVAVGRRLLHDPEWAVKAVKRLRLG